MKPIGYLLLPVGILIGWAFGLLFQGSAHSDQTASAAERAPAGPLSSASAPPSQALREAPTISDSASAAPTTEASAAAIERAVRTALASAPRALNAAAERRAGNATLRGTVVTGEGAPLAGVQVRLAPLSADAQRLAQRVVGPAIQTATDSLADQARRLLDVEARALLATSAADGAFGFQIEAERIYSIALHLPGWRFDRTDGQGTHVAAGAAPAFLASPLASLELDLTDSVGQPVESAVIAYAGVSRGNDSWNFVSWNRAQPRLEFSPGTYRLLALSADAEPWCPERSALWLSSERSAPAELSLAARAEPHVERWQLLPRPTLYGRMLLSGAEARSAAGYGLALLTPGAQKPEKSDFGDGYRYFETPHFLLTSEEPGAFDLRLIWKGAEESSVLATVELAQGNLRQDFTVSARAENPRLFISAKGPDGQPIDSLGTIQFWASSPSGGTTGHSGYNALPAGPGRFELRVPDSLQAQFFRPLLEPEAGGKSSCEFDHPKYGKRQLEFVAGQTEYSLEFSVPSTLAVAIRGATPAGEGKFYTVVLTEPSSASRWRRDSDLEPEIGPSGSWTGSFKNLQAGDYRVSLQLNTGSPKTGYSSDTLMGFSVKVAPGANSVEFDLNLLSELRVRVPGAQGGHLLLAGRGSGAFGHDSNKHTEISEEGLGIFEQVAPGDYILNYNDGFMLVRCPSAEVQFTPNPANCMRMHIWNDSGPLAQAGLRSGDAITAVDGAAFDPEAWQQATSKKAAARDLRLTVRRGDSSVSVTVSSQAFGEDGGGFGQPSYEP